MPLTITNQDITSMKLDAIVNSTNSNLIGYSGVDHIIHEKCGEALETECEQLRGKYFLGESTHTHAYNLACKWIIHTISPVWNGGREGEAAILRSCYKTALAEADKLKCKSVAFPLIAAGSSDYPIPAALEQAITSITEYLQLYTDMDVYLVLYDTVAQKIYASEFKDLDKYINEQFEGSHGDSAKSLDDYLATAGDDFATMLMHYVDSKGMTDAQLYKKAGISKATYHKILSGGTKVPSMQTASALALGLELSYEEAVKFLASGGLAFSASSKFDLIITYFLKNHVYDIWKVDEQLYKYGYKTLLGASE